MAVIIDLNFSDGATYGGWDSTTVDNSGVLAWTAAAAMAGTATGQASTAGASGSHASGLIDVTAITSKNLRFRYYLDPNSVTMDNAATQTMIQLKDTSQGAQNRSNTKLRYLTASGYQLDFDWKNDASSFHGALTVNITDAPHLVECEIVKATGASANDGQYRIWVDGVLGGEQTNIDLFTSFGFNRFMAGPILGGASTNTRGTLYIDQIIVNDDGGTIGPIGPQARAGGGSRSGTSCRGGDGGRLGAYAR